MACIGVVVMPLPFYLIVFTCTVVAVLCLCGYYRKVNKPRHLLPVLGSKHRHFWLEFRDVLGGIQEEAPPVDETMKTEQLTLYTYVERKKKGTKNRISEGLQHTYYIQP